MTAHVPPSRSSSPSLEGTLVAGKYRVLHMIGSGGMGTVWAGVHTMLGTRVAIKFIRPAFAALPDARQRFEIEARAAARLNSKNAVQVFDYGVNESGLAYIVMEYLEGESLSEALIKRGPLPAREVALLIKDAANALTRAHAAGVVHRDLKPDNIFLAANVESERGALPYTVKLVDFGIAKMFDAPRVAGHETPAPMGGPTLEGAVIGTPNFMAPEQLTLGGAPGPLTDLWSLGACAFAAMTARIPFEGDVLGDIVIKVCAAPMPVPSSLNPEVPPGFDAWFERACSRDPRRRFQTATELSEALSQVCLADGARTAGTARVHREERVQYRLNPPAEGAEPVDSIPVPSSMSARTALMAGLVLGVTMMVGIAGALAWRAKAREAEMPREEAPAVSTAAVPVPPAASLDAGAMDAGERDRPRERAR